MPTVAGITLREATVGDAGAIAEVHVASWRWAYDGLLPPSVLDALSVEGRAAAWHTVLADAPGAVTVAVVDDDDNGGAIVGFVSVGPTPDEDDPPPGTGALFALYLHPDTVGAGAGKTLLEHGEAQLRDEGFTRATLWVLETNERARRFYERRGWAWDGARGEHRFDCGNRPIVRYAREL